jgi:hypothetical protein
LAEGFGWGERLCHERKLARMAASDEWGISDMLR